MLHAESTHQSRLAFGSCNRQYETQALWPEINKHNPELFIWMGDAVYHRSTDFQAMKSVYDQQLANPDYQNFLKSVPLLATWDDHDFGRQTAERAGDFVKKSQELFLDFLGEPENSSLRQQSGIYHSQSFGPADQRIKIILLDSRSHRQLPGKNSDLLGEEQWKWLENELLDQSVDSFLIVSSHSVFFPAGFGVDSWRTYPKSFKRLMQSIKDKPGVLFLVGDLHSAGYRSERAIGRRYYELLASGMTHTLVKKRDSSILRLIYGGRMVFKKNFGLLTFHWDEKPLRLTYESRGVEDQVWFTVNFQLQANGSWRKI